MSLKDQFGKDILLTGWGHSRFGKLTEETLESLITQVGREAITNAGLEPGQIDEIFLGQFNSGMMPLGFPSSLALQISDDLANTPATRVENACASGSAALQQGVKSLLAGTARHVLVIGAEKMTHAGPETVGAALLGADYDAAGQNSTTGLETLSLRNPQPGAMHLAFLVPDIDPVFARVTQRGGIPLSEPVTITEGINAGGRACYLKGPDGITIELLQRPVSDEASQP